MNIPLNFYGIKIYLTNLERGQTNVAMEALLQGLLSTVDLRVRTILYRLVSIWEIMLQAILMRRPAVLNIPLQLVFPGFSIDIKAHIHWRSLLAKLSVVLCHENTTSLTYLGHVGQHDTDKFISHRY